MIFRRVVAALVAPLVLGTTGCYTAVAVPVSQPGLQRAAPVEAELSEPVTLRAADRDIQFVVRLTGLYIDMQENHLMVSADRLVSQDGQHFATSGATVRVPIDRVRLLQTRVLDRTRTAFFTAGIVAGVVVLPALLGGGWMGTEIWQGGDDRR
jgi:hypothetical protein